MNNQNIYNMDSTNNYLKCNYNKNENPNDLYDVYTAFIKGNLFKDLYNEYKIKPYEIRPINQQAELLTYIDMYSFVATDLNLYLDVHPNDADMINYFNQITNEGKGAIMQYENEYGPLFVSATENYPWTWNNSPWPWEGSNV